MGIERLIDYWEKRVRMVEHDIQDKRYRMQTIQTVELDRVQKRILTKALGVDEEDTDARARMVTLEADLSRKIERREFYDAYHIKEVLDSLKITSKEILGRKVLAQTDCREVIGTMMARHREDLQIFDRIAQNRLDHVKRRALAALEDAKSPMEDPKAQRVFLRVQASPYVDEFGMQELTGTTEAIQNLYHYPEDVAEAAAARQAAEAQEAAARAQEEEQAAMAAAAIKASDRSDKQALEWATDVMMAEEESLKTRAPLQLAAHQKEGGAAAAFLKVHAETEAKRAKVAAARAWSAVLGLVKESQEEAKQKMAGMPMVALLAQKREAQRRMEAGHLAQVYGNMPLNPRFEQWAARVERWYTSLLDKEKGWELDWWWWLDVPELKHYAGQEELERRARDGQLGAEYNGGPPKYRPFVAEQEEEVKQAPKAAGSRRIRPAPPNHRPFETDPSDPAALKKASQVRKWGLVRGAINFGAFKGGPKKADTPDPVDVHDLWENLSDDGTEAVAPAAQGAGSPGLEVSDYSPDPPPVPGPEAPAGYEGRPGRDLVDNPDKTWIKATSMRSGKVVPGQDPANLPTYQAKGPTQTWNHKRGLYFKSQGNTQFVKAEERLHERLPDPPNLSPVVALASDPTAVLPYPQIQPHVRRPSIDYSLVFPPNPGASAQIGPVPGPVVLKPSGPASPMKKSSPVAGSPTKGSQMHVHFQPHSPHKQTGPSTSYVNPPQFTIASPPRKQQGAIRRPTTLVVGERPPPIAIPSPTAYTPPPKPFTPKSPMKSTQGTQGESESHSSAAGPTPASPSRAQQAPLHVPGPKYGIEVQPYSPPPKDNSKYSRPVTAPRAAASPSSSPSRAKVGPYQTIAKLGGAHNIFRTARG